MVALNGTRWESEEEVGRSRESLGGSVDVFSEALGEVCGSALFGGCINIATGDEQP